MNLILRRRLQVKLLMLLFIAMLFAIGWLYLDYVFFLELGSFDFELHVSPEEMNVIKGNTAKTAVIVFSGNANSKPVELYFTNCPKYSSCYLSVSNAMPTFSSELVVETTEATPPGVYTINVIAAGGMTKKSATLYLDVEPVQCACGSWVNRGCGGMCGSMMYLSRVCSPRSCDDEARCAYNASCILDFDMESIPSSAKAYHQSAIFTIKITSKNNFSDYVYLSTSSCPVGSVCEYSNNPVFVPSGGTGSSELVVTTALGATIGVFNITTVGVNNNTINTVNSTLTIA